MEKNKILNMNDNNLNAFEGIPVLFTQKKECCGCGACNAVCLGVSSFNKNIKAIEMNLDDEGFLYPIIDSEICIRCYRCISVCPIRTVGV